MLMMVLLFAVSVAVVVTLVGRQLRREHLRKLVGSQAPRSISSRERGILDAELSAVDASPQADEDEYY